MCFYGSLAAIIFWHNRFRWFTVIAVLLFTAVPLLVDSSHEYRGLHYPSDVLAGALLGSLWLTVAIVYAGIHDGEDRRHPSADADRAMASGR